MGVTKKKQNLSKRKKETKRDKESVFKIKKKSPYETIEDFPGFVQKKFPWKKFLLISGTVLGTLVLGILLYYFCFFPTLSLNGSETIEVVYPQLYEEPGVTLTRFGKEVHYPIQTKGEVNNQKLGNYKITYTYSEWFLSKKVTRNVSIVDKEPPVLTLEGSTDLKLCPHKSYEEEGYSATDNYDGDLTDQVTVEEKEGAFVYTVKDSSGNEVTSSRTVQYVDDEAPKITLKGNQTIYQTVGTTYKEPGYTVSDNCDGDLAKQVKVTGSVDSKTVGTYTLTYTISDTIGNKSEVKRKVVVYKPEPNTGVIYLTFDDGPSATNTAKILDTLKKYNVKATFFVTMSGPDSMILREYQEGHTVALHTASHDYAKVYKSVDAYFSDLTKVQNRVKNITGQTSYIIRFPGGSSNTVSRHYSIGIMSTLTKEVQKRGYRYYDWNVSSGDAGETTSSQGVYNYVVGGLKRNRANIVLMHDIKSYTAAALESIIQYGLNNGYTFAAITMNTPEVHQRVNN